jgi:outer membrane autotransporter protein
MNGALSNSGTISGLYAGINNNGTISTLTNSGVISDSNHKGIYNTGSINTLTNSGAISANGASSYGIYNVYGGAIGTAGVDSSGLYNTGAIQGGYVGIYNGFDDSIITLSNSGGGVISGGIIGIDNSYGNITVLNNTLGGVISGGNIGIINGGTIDTLNNSGVISSTVTITSGTVNGNGINNVGMIDTLNNAVGGTISSTATISGTGAIGTISGIYNQAATTYGSSSPQPGGTIGTLNNSGLVTGATSGLTNGGTITVLNNTVGGTISGSIGINNLGPTTTIVGGGSFTITTTAGTIGTLNNGGTISGAAYAINNSGSLGTITNAGVIAGNIANTSSNALSINGGAGAVFGTLTGFSAGSIGTITNTASNVAFGAGNQLLNDNINVGSNTVTNTGTLQINNQIGITGNYSQSAAGALKIGVADNAVTSTGTTSDTGYGRLVVSGSANIAAGSSVALTKLNSYNFAQGQRYVVVQAASSGTNYNAGSLIYTATGFQVTGASVVDGGNSSVLDLVLTLGNGISSAPINSATSANAVASLSGLFNYANSTGTNAALMALSNAVAALGGSPAEANRAGAQLSPTATVAATSQAAAAPTQAVLGVVGAHVDGMRVAQADGQSGVAAGESASGVAMWGQAFGGNATQGMRDGISGYHAGYNGLLIGADTQLGDNWRVGGLGSYANTSVANDGDNSGSATHVTSYGLIGYAGYAADKWYLDMSAGAVQQQYNSMRAIGFNGFSGTANGQFNGMQYVASVQGGYPIKLASNTTLTPLAGLSYSRQHQDAYTESGGNGAALNVGATNSNSVKSDIGAKLERSFVTAYGALAPSAQLTWRHEYEKNGVQSVSSFAADTTGVTSFTTLGPTPIADTGVLVLGVTLTRSENVSLTARYSVEAASGYTSQTADVRLRYQF